MSQDVHLDSNVPGNPAYLRFTIPPGTYVGVDAATRTIATPAMLLARADLSDAEIAAVTRRVFSAQGDLLARGSSQGAQISLSSAASALAVPQHVAAVKALAEMAAGNAAETGR